LFKREKSGAWTQKAGSRLFSGGKKKEKKKKKKKKKMRRNMPGSAFDMGGYVARFLVSSVRVGMSHGRRGESTLRGEPFGGCLLPRSGARIDNASLSSDRIRRKCPVVSVATAGVRRLDQWAGDRKRLAGDISIRR